MSKCLHITAYLNRQPDGAPINEWLLLQHKKPPVKNRRSHLRGKQQGFGISTTNEFNGISNRRNVYGGCRNLFQRVL